MDALKKAINSIRETARVREKARLDFESEVYGARLEGLEIGRAIGRAEVQGLSENEIFTRINFLRKLIEMPISSQLTDTEISQICGLSPKTVKAARDRKLIEPF